MNKIIPKKSDNLRIKVDALLAQYSNVYQEFFSLCQAGMQAIVALAAGLVALIGYAIEFQTNRILLIVPLFITLLGAFILFTLIAQTNKRCVLAILEKHINTLISKGTEKYMFSNSAFLWGELYGEEKYSYCSPIQKYMKHALISCFIIVFPFYIWSVYKGALLIGNLYTVWFFAYISLVTIPSALIIKWSWDSLVKTREGMTSELNRPSKCPV